MAGVHCDCQSGDGRLSEVEEYKPVFGGGVLWKTICADYSAAILDWNANVEEGRKIPLASVLIGDGWTSPTDQYPAIYEVACFEVDGITPIFNSTQCVEADR